MNSKKVKLIIIILLIIASAFIFNILKQGYQDATTTDLTDTFAAMSSKHYFGTDHLGRDIYSLMIDGAVRTLLTILIACVISLSIGVLMGTLGGYYGKSVELVIQFVTDLMMIVPTFILALIFSAIFGLNPISAGIALGISGIGDYANQAMILTKEVKTRGFILSEKAMGINSMKVITKHIIPNIMPPIYTALGNKASSIALQYAALSFIGLGADITKPDWGALLYQYRIYIIERPLLLLWPTLGIFIIAFSSYILMDAKGE